MFTLTLSHRDIHVAAAALVEGARRRTREDEAGKASRAVARILADVLPLAYARGEVVLDLTDEQADVLSADLRRAASGPRWYGSRAPVPPASFDRLAATLGA